MIKHEWTSDDGSIRLICGDCLEVLPTIEAGSVDAVIADLPYGTTACSWDAILPFESLWVQLNHACKTVAPMVMFGSEPFSTAMRASNLRSFRYDWIWEKTNAVDFVMARRRPRKMHEVISVFSREQHRYIPQMQSGSPYMDKPRRRSNSIHDSTMPKLGIVNNGTRYPSSVQRFSNGNNGRFHPTQKPVVLVEYLVRTYTNEGEIVLDNTMGSGTTGVACVNTSRKFIGIEIDEGYFNIAVKRIKAALIERSELLIAS